ncbi:MAG: hypothetical protein M0004_08525 [Actinomycetota bacterium]|nr:hypothetical protein [Actinomycetota bacterium]
MPSDQQHFAYAVDRRFAVLLALIGADVARDGVALDAAGFFARLGPVRLATKRSNVLGAHVTGPYHWWKAIGIRRSFADSGLTFGTNARAGVCVHFATPVPSPLRRRGHEALTVTVADPDGLVAALQGAPSP